MYRAVTLAGFRARIDFRNAEAIARLAEALELEMPPGRVVLNGEDVTGLIRTKEITAASGAVASSTAVRARLVAMQRALAVDRNLVCEGRDQGTIVFPEALCKFFLVADPQQRAVRRQREMASRGEEIPMDEVLAAQRTRDEGDANRQIAPMRPAADAVILDTTELTLEQVVERMEQEVRGRLARQLP
jgi:cytidylate kinase